MLPGTPLLAEPGTTQLSSGTVVAVALAAGIAGALIGAGSRRWIGTLRRGAIVRAGWFEVGCGLISAAGVVLSPPERWPLVLWIGLLTVTLSAIDLRHHRLPDAITLPAAPLTLLVAGGTELVWPESGSWWRALLGGVVLGGAFYLLTLAGPAAMGRGDAKLAVTLGIALSYVSWAALLLGVLAGFLLGALAAVAGVLARRLSLRSAIPFGPALLLGCWLVLAVPLPALTG